MKKLTLLILIATTSLSLASGVGTVRIRQQVGSVESNQVERVITPTATNQVLGFNASKVLTNLTIGTIGTIASGKTVAFSNSLTFAGTDGTTITFQGTGTYMSRSSTDAVTGTKTFNDGAAVLKAGTGSETFLPSGVIYYTGTAVNTGANTTETDGATKSVGGNTLSGNGKSLRFKIWGTTAANTNTKTVQLYWGGTSVFTTGAVAANAKPWYLEMVVIRTGVGGQTILVNGQFNATPVAGVATATKDETGALIVKNTMTNGTGTASDCTTSGATLEVLP